MSGILILVISWLLTVTTMDAVRLNQKIFMDIKSIEFLDPQMNGVLFVLNDRFVKNYLQDNQFPTLYLTVLSLDRTTPRTTKILYPELTDNGGKDVTVNKLQQSTWYFACLEFESITRQNETVGCECRIFRTLDKFGNNQQSIVKNVDLLDVDDQNIKLRIKFDPNHPKIQLTASLSPDQKLSSVNLEQKSADFLIESKNFIITNETRSITVIFGNLGPKTDFGRFCLIERPLTDHALYTAMGRLVDLSNENCFLENQLITKEGSRPTQKHNENLIRYKHSRQSNGYHRSYDVAAQRYTRNQNSAMWKSVNSLLSLSAIIAFLFV